jgi:cyclohexyl-isocyanide hydratase
MNIAVLLFHHAHELDAVGPYSALSAARHFVDEEALNLYTVAKSRNSVETSGGLVITPDWAFASAPVPEVLIVPGGAGVETARRDRALLAYLRGAAGVRILASVCTGAFLLGELGLLRDQRATTHAAHRERLLDYEVGEIVDARVVKNESGLWCAGGVTAGIDLGLELTLELFGTGVARKVAERINYPFWAPPTG